MLRLQLCNGGFRQAQTHRPLGFLYILQPYILYIYIKRQKNFVKFTKFFSLIPILFHSQLYTQIPACKKINSEGNSKKRYRPHCLACFRKPLRIKQLLRHNRFFTPILHSNGLGLIFNLSFALSNSFICPFEPF